jgi:hypothetical protein
MKNNSMEIFAITKQLKTGVGKTSNKGSEHIEANSEY